MTSTTVYEAEIIAKAKKTLSQMSERRIPLLPRNYTIWYEFCQGNNQDLVRDINRLIELDKPLSEQIHVHLYDKYFADQQNQTAAHSATDEARTILSRILEQLMTAAKSSGDYHLTLSGLSKQLEDAKDVTSIQRLIGEIMQHTEVMVASSRDLQKRLEEESSRAENLRIQLEKTKHEALTDTLTGLHNRKALDKKTEELLKEFGVSDAIFSVLMLDIDHFKIINDRHGHLIGDAVIRKVAQSISQQIKGFDFAARYGGEEFAVLLPNTKLEESAVVAEHIRIAVENMRLEIVHSSQTLPKTTISIGATEVQQHDTPDTLFNRADKALYMAKHTGRNRVKTSIA